MSISPQTAHAATRLQNEIRTDDLRGIFFHFSTDEKKGPSAVALPDKRTGFWYFALLEGFNSTKDA
jgi:hypothetical protein